MKKTSITIITICSVVLSVYAQQDSIEKIREKVIVILNDIIQPAINQAKTPDWDRLKKEIKEKYNSYYADRVVMAGKMRYYFNKDWAQYTNNLTAYTEKYIQQSESQKLDGNAYDIAQYSTDKSELQKALGWSRQAVNNEPGNKDYKNTLEILQSLIENESIRFVGNLNWEAIKAKAKKEHKYIFIDCYATWCNPCRFMLRNIFTRAKVSEFMNDKFISVSVQMDTTAKDNLEVKRWRADASRIAKEYQVNVYPTFIFLNEDGNPLHKIIGADKDGDSFLARVNDALKENKQYYTLVNGYRQHLQDSAFLFDAAVAAYSVGDIEKMMSIGGAYFDCIKNPYDKKNLRFLLGSIPSTNSRAFKLFSDHMVEVDTSLGVGAAQKILCRIIKSEEVDPVTKAGNVNWMELSERLKIKYPALAERALLVARVEYYQEHHQNTDDKREYCKSIVEFMRAGAGLEAGRLGGWNNVSGGYNNAAWEIFELSNEKDELEAALDWSRRSILLHESDYPSMDTYANLLYKTGKKKEAMVWETKVICMSNGIDKDGFLKTLEKMRKGEKTWDE